MIYTGVVESRMDPLKLGRCQVRVHGLHTHDKNVLPTSDLPWAYPLQSLTSAAMSGIGRAPVGVVEGTTVMIVFMDDDQQQPVMLGSMGGIPQQEGSVDNTVPPLMFNDVDGDDTATPTTLPVTTDSGPSVPPSIAPATAPTSPTTPPINGIPGQAPFAARDGSNVIPNAKSANGILAIGRAMDKLGVTGSYARAAILGIIGGESEWIPQNEGYKYSTDRLGQVFSWMTPDQVNQYANWKGAPEDFFRFVYGPTTRSGKNLGNKGANDGALYYGRGYVQLTGAYNYSKYAKLSGVDCVNNPALLNDLDQGALIAVSYFVDRVKNAQNDPGYFDAACQAVGYNVPNIKVKKQNYYRYFLLADTTASEVPQESQKTAVPGTQPPNIPIASTGLPVDRQAGMTLGFRDPNMKYPLREFFNEPDTNRLARGRVDGTSVSTRDNTRMTQVPIADGTTWSQPPIPFNARYPYNRMEQSESGHLFELDDTPDNERVNFMHRTGSGIEIDVNGTQVNRIVGDGYEIIDRNGYVYVKGAYSITAEGTTQIYVNADCYLRVAGHTQIDLEQDLDMNVARDFNLNIGGNWNTTVAGNNTLQIGGTQTVNVGSTDTLVVGSNQSITINGDRSDKITGKFTSDIGGDNSVKIGGSRSVEVGSNDSSNVTGSITVLGQSRTSAITSADTQVASTMLITASSLSMGSTSGDTTFSTTGNFYYKSTGIYSIDANRIDLNQGNSSGITPPNPTIPSIGAQPHIDSTKSLPMASPPSFGNPASNSFANLTTPPRNFEIDTSFETPEEVSTTPGQTYFADREVVGTKSTPVNTPAEAATAAPTAVVTSAPASCDLIYGMNDFPLSLQMSSSFTLGNLICDPKHIIADQMLQDNRGSNARRYTKQEIVCNLKGLSENILEVLVATIPGGKAGFVITSGYRYAGLTANESKISDHPKGNAVDIVLAGKNFDYQAHYDLANQLAPLLPYHQMILEYRDAGRPGNSRGKRIVWLHIAHRYTGAAKQAFTMLNDKTYGQGFILLN